MSKLNRGFSFYGTELAFWKSSNKAKSPPSVFSSFAAFHLYIIKQGRVGLEIKIRKY
jgi:hypothetical protein